MRRCARAALAALLVGALGVPPAGAQRTFPIVEVPPAACDVCTPGKPPPPPEVQEQLRRLNADVNWRRQPSTGETIPLGTATRVWLQRAWASGRLQPGVANLGSNSAASRATGFRASSRRQARTSLASRSRSRLADRRSTRDEGRSSRSRRSRDTDDTTGRSSFGTGSSLGTSRSGNTFGQGSSFSSGMNQSFP